MAELATLARPYAKAAFGFALESNQLDGWATLLNDASFIVKQPKIKALVNSPSLQEQEQIGLIEKLLGNEINSSFLRFLALLSEHKRVLLLPAIAERFNKLKEQHQKMADVFVESAFEIDAETEQKLSEKLQATLQCDVNINKTIEPDLIGGVVIRAGDLVIDSSIRGRLAKLSEAMGL